MNRKKILSVILTLILFLVCVSACQAANPRQTAKSQTADRQASEVQTETTSHGTTSLDLTEPEISHEKERMESAPTAGKFDFETRMVLLNSGYTMPIMGLGTYALDHDTCVNSVKTLLKNGGRLIDTRPICITMRKPSGRASARPWRSTAFPGKKSS